MQEGPQEILNIKNYHLQIEETIPSWKPILYHVSTRESSYNSLAITSTDVPGDISISSHQSLFCPKDVIIIALRKWCNTLGQDYNYFCDVYSSKFDIDTLSNYKIVEVNDLLELFGLSIQ